MNKSFQNLFKLSFWDVDFSTPLIRYLSAFVILFCVFCISYYAAFTLYPGLPAPKDKAVKYHLNKTLAQQVRPFFSLNIGWDWIRMYTHVKSVECNNEKCVAKLDVPVIGKMPGDWLDTRESYNELFDSNPQLVTANILLTPSKNKIFGWKVADMPRDYKSMASLIYTNVPTDDSEAFLIEPLESSTYALGRNTHNISKLLSSMVLGLSIFTVCRICVKLLYLRPRTDPKSI